MNHVIVGPPASIEFFEFIFHIKRRYDISCVSSSYKIKHSNIWQHSIDIELDSRKAFLPANKIYYLRKKSRTHFFEWIEKYDSQTENTNMFKLESRVQIISATWSFIKLISSIGIPCQWRCCYTSWHNHAFLVLFQFWFVEKTRAK